MGLVPEGAAQEPKAPPELRTVAMPRDANASGDIFGGWVLSQMDVAGGVVASRRAKGRVATVAIEAMRFHKPIAVGDLVNCYAAIARVGTTSITVRIEAWVNRRLTGEAIKVTEGTFVYVALDSEGRKRPVPSAGSGL